MATVNNTHTNAVVEALGALFDGGKIVLVGDGPIVEFTLETPAFTRTGTGRIQARGLPKQATASVSSGDEVKEVELVSADGTLKITGLLIATPGGALPGQSPHVVIDRLPVNDGDTVRLLSFVYTRSQTAARTPQSLS